MPKPHRLLLTLPLLAATLACLGSAPNPSATAPLWEVTPFDFGGGTTYANGIFYVLTGSQELVALDELTGGTLWQIDADFARLSPDRSLLYAAFNDTCTAYNATTGALPRSPLATPGYLCDYDRRDDSNFNFTVADDQTLTASDAATGEPLWQTNLGLDQASVFLQPPASDPYITAENVLVHSKGYKSGDDNTSYLNLQAFAPQTGNLIWQLTDKYFGTAAIAGNLVFLVYSETGATVPNDNNSIPTPTGQFELVALDLRTGIELWHTTTDYSVNLYPVGNILYQCFDDRTFRWWDTTTGAQLGEKKLSDAGSSCPNATTENLYVANDVWLTTGSRTSPDAGLSFTGPYDGWVTAWQISSGKITWSTDIHEKEMIGVSALGQKVALVPWQTGYRGYLLQKP